MSLQMELITRFYILDFRIIAGRTDEKNEIVEMV